MDAQTKRSPALPVGPKPYFQSRGAVLYCGEALRILPAVPAAIAAAALTDPPYSSGGLFASDRTADVVSKYCQQNDSRGRPTFSGDNRDQRSYRFWSVLWMGELQRIVRPTGYGLVFSDWRQLPTVSDAMQAAGWIWRGVVAWNKGRGARAPHKGYFKHQCEYVLWATNGRCAKRETDGPLDGCFQESVRQADKHHVTGKPTALLRELVRCTDPGELVLDPFAGSGTTGVACLETGRRFLGIELSEPYCEIAARRLEAAERQGQRFQPDR